ncbi:MAG TPA: heparin lyase I family protein [Dongiaceae bacterium]|nr:heparin lyase I family protein [Dongiaceae bacterium]
MRLILCIALCLPAVASAQSTTTAESKPTYKKVVADEIALSAEFEGAFDRSVNVAYFCKGVAKFVPAPTSDRPDNEAVLLTLDPTKTSAVGRCEPSNAPTERAELAEPDELRLPLGTEVWYGFRFMIPASMKGRLAGERVVIAQLKQHPNTCPLGPQPFGPAAEARGNPTISVRIIEDDPHDAMGLQLAVAGDYAPKVSVGQLMYDRDGFLARWHQVVLHAKVTPREERHPDNAGFVEGWLDGQPFASDLYGMMDGKGTADPAEPFGYAGLVGCTYFKYGIYRDSRAEPWSLVFDHFRRGATRKSVEIPQP